MNLNKLTKTFLVTAVIGVGISYSKLYLFHIFLLGIYYLFGKEILIRKNLFFLKQTTRFHYFFYIFIIWYSISIFWSWDKMYTIQYIIYILCGISISLCIIYVTSNTSTLRKVFYLLSGIFILEMLIGYLEAFTPFRLPTSTFSKHAQFFKKENVDFSRIKPEKLSETLSMPTVFHGNPNDFAIVLGILFPFFLFHKNNKIKILGIFSVLILVYMTGSRGVFIAIFLMILGYLFLFNKKRAFISLITIPIVSIMLVLVVNNTTLLENNNKLKEFTFALVAAKSYLSPSEKDQNSKEASIGVRRQLVQNGIEALKETNGLGVGGGSSIKVQELKGGKVATTKSMHNFWIEILVDGGILFFFVFLVWYVSLSVSLYVKSRKHKNSFEKYLASSLFLAMVGFSISCISASSVIYFFPMWILLGLSIATLNIINNKSQSYNKVDIR